MSPAPGFTREQRAALEALKALSDAGEAGGAIVLRTPEAPDSPMLNRIVGLGVDAPATESDVDAALDALGDGVSFYLTVAPGAEPPELVQWLRARGLESGWGWMQFHRDVSPPAAASAATSLRLGEVATPADAQAFARVVRESYGLPEALEPRLARAHEHGWMLWVAWDGDEPAGAAGLYVCDGVGYVGLAGTRTEYRGAGAQNALLAERIRRAAELGCDVLVSETGERGDRRPSNSYRNILRAGFSEVAVTANWFGRR
jgi:GNAT superfamily N-acetyltransferase